MSAKPSTRPPAQVSFGVIGLGWHGTSHLQNLAANPRARIAAVCDLDAERLAAQADAYGVPLRFTDYHELLGRDDVDAVVIVVPDHLHREPAVAALDAGKHVLLEKPMATTVADAEAIAAAARRNEGTFMLNLSNRWMYPFAKGKEVLDGGSLGDVRYVHTRMANRSEVPLERLRWLSHSHLAHWLGIHRLDIARWWIGREIVRVRAVQRRGVLTAKGCDVPDFFQATLEFDGGAVVNLEENWILPESYPSMVDSRFYALCENGVIDVDRTRSELNIAGAEAFEASTPTNGPALDQQAGFTYAAERHFVDCVLDGRDPLTGADDGLALTRALCAVVESAEQDGKTIKLPAGG